ncbi:PH domain-containing protein [Streptomyces sp. NPDC001407]|uniref:PH domain-containing protein n=1 Tax=Streptomyces sp. NPDC001407 TaxID=3364573 RepID=UPI0036A611CA
MTCSTVPDRLFAPPGMAFTRLPRPALSLWRVDLALGAALSSAAVAGLVGFLLPRCVSIVPSWPGWGLAGLLAAWGAFRWWRLGAAWQRCGYSLTGNELLFRSGMFRRRLEALPYGRIQSVEVSSGPLQRRFGVATVTVATGTFHHLRVHDVSTAEAERIRDVLTSLATERQVSL